MRLAFAAVLVAAAGCASPATRPEPVFSFGGRVVSDLGEPVTVTLDTVLPWMHGGERAMPQQHFEAVVAPGGRFRFDGVEAGAYQLVAKSPSSARFEDDEVVVRGDVADADIRLFPACRVAGRVTYGPGIDPADCWLLWTRGRRTWDLGRDAIRDGRFVLADLEPGPIAITVRHWPDRDASGNAPLRVETRAELTLVAGDNPVEIRIDANSSPAR